MRDGPRRQLVQVGQPRAELFARRAPRLKNARALDASNPSSHASDRHTSILDDYQHSKAE